MSYALSATHLLGTGIDKAYHVMDYEIVSVEGSSIRFDAEPPLYPSTRETMVFSFFKKSVGKSAGKSTDVPVEKPKRNPVKAQKFFEHARTHADSRQYDYAIDLYIDGLRQAPDALTRHEELLDVAKRRKVTGGKAAKLSEKLSGGGDTAVDRMLHAEKLWAKDPMNVRMMVAMMERAVEAEKAEPELNLSEVAFWVGELILAAPKRPGVAELVTVRDLFAGMKAWDRAVEAGGMALSLDPGNDELRSAQHSLETELTMDKGGYASENASEVDFRRSIRDKDKQTELDSDNATARTGSKQDQLIARARQDYQDDPEDVPRLQKLAERLLESADREHEQEAIELYDKAFEQTGQYKYKVRIGDIRMKQFVRQLRALTEAVKSNPKDSGAKDAHQSLLRKKLEFELEEYAERVRNYPTDLTYRFELARRLLATGKHDEAIAEFQVTKANPKLRAQSHAMLARCYEHKTWFDEAIDTLRKGIELHEISDDALGLEMRYMLMDNLQRNAEKLTDSDRHKALECAREAQHLASHILQTKISYKDIQERMEALRTLTDRLGKPA